jgi:Prenyltransferase and squalene oxidase repeat
MRRHILLIAALLALFAGRPPAYAADDPAAASQAAVRWLTARQQNDGSFPGFGVGSSADAILALAAAGIDPNSVQKQGASGVTALASGADAFARSSTAAASKTLLAALAAGKSPRSFGGIDLVALITQSYSATTGVYGQNPTDHAFALIALAGAGEAIPAEALTAAATLQRADGGWSFDGASGNTSDSNTAALMVQGLVASGASGSTLSRAVAYLKLQQNKDGGFTYSMESTFGTDSDANSTALVIQALVAAGEDPRAQPNGDAIAALLALQNASGAFRYQTAVADDNDLATAQAIPALLQKPFPLKLAAVPAAPVALPNTGGEALPLWALALAASLLMGGAALRRASRGV